MERRGGGRKGCVYIADIGGVRNNKICILCVVDIDDLFYASFGRRASGRGPGG